MKMTGVEPCCFYIALEDKVAVYMSVLFKKKKKVLNGDAFSHLLGQVHRSSELVHKIGQNGSCCNPVFT